MSKYKVLAPPTCKNVNMKMNYSFGFLSDLPANKMCQKYQHICDVVVNDWMLFSNPYS